MSQQTLYPAVPIAPSTKFCASEPLKMSPISDSLAPSTPVDDDMFAWLAPPCQDFEQTTPPQSPSISLADDPVLFDLDLGSETDPVSPDVLFSMSDLMDVEDGPGMTFHHSIDSDLDLNLPHHDPDFKEGEIQRDENRHDALERTTLVSDVLSDSQDSFTSANEGAKSKTAQLTLPSVNVDCGHAMSAPSLSQTIENISLEPLSSPDLSRVDTSVSEKTASPTRENLNRSPMRKTSGRAEMPTSSIAKNRGSLTVRESGTETVAATTTEVAKGSKPMQQSLRKRMRPSSTSQSRENDVSTRTTEKNVKTEVTNTKPVKVGMRIRRKGAVEKRMGKGIEDEKNVPVLDRCVKCSTMAKNTPMMRKGPDGCRSLCNACGLKWSRHGIY